MSRAQLRLWTTDFYRAVDPQMLQVGFHQAHPGWLSAPKQQLLSDFDLWYVAAGCGAVRVDGAWHTFKAGDLMALKPGSVYQQERADRADPFQIYFCHVLPFGRRDPGLDGLLAGAWPLRVSMLHRPEVSALFNRLFEEHIARPSTYSLAVKGVGLQLLDMIFRELRESHGEPAPRTRLNLLRAKELIEAQYARQLSLGEIAQHSGLGRSHLSALFRQHLGCPPVEFLIRVRLRQAKLLLARGVRVKEVAQATGFRSQHYFSRLFRRRMGLAPTEFAMRYARPG
jgi:AraC family transcriptional regulator, transcriptional activator for feuABC-ybbA operon